MTSRATPASVFVLMLENHSFDHVFAMSRIPGIEVATVDDCNTHRRRRYFVRDGAPRRMPTDPGHEFEDVVTQLCGSTAAYTAGRPYPRIDSSGFVANYAVSTSEGTGRPPAGRIGDVMACFRTERQLPVIRQLAKEFAVCDRWFSSMPGPTWPNRFFVHGASSAGMDRSPTRDDLRHWYRPDGTHGFEYPNGSIYDALGRGRHRWGLYNDSLNQFRAPGRSKSFGGIAQVASLKGISQHDVQPIAQLIEDLEKPSYPYAYTFIEPNYGESDGLSYANGSSQHPEDDPYGGECLIKTVYEAIRGSRVWSRSLLIVTYDEHGGFFDSVPPVKAVSPGDCVHKSLNAHGFDFRQYGVRVPAVVISPWIAAGTVDHTLYDHTSILATLERLLDIEPLTKRDACANHLLHLLNAPRLRTDCPRTLCDPAPPPGANRYSRRHAAVAQQPLPESGNAIGLLHVALKTDLERVGGDESKQAAILERFKKISTKGQARSYLESMMSNVEAARRNRAPRGPRNR